MWGSMDPGRRSLFNDDASSDGSSSDNSGLGTNVKEISLDELRQRKREQISDAHKRMDELKNAIRVVKNWGQSMSSGRLPDGTAIRFGPFFINKLKGAIDRAQVPLKLAGNALDNIIHVPERGVYSFADLGSPYPNLIDIHSPLFGELQSYKEDLKKYSDLHAKLQKDGRAATTDDGSDMVAEAIRRATFADLHIPRPPEDRLDDEDEDQELPRREAYSEQYNDLLFVPSWGQAGMVLSEAEAEEQAEILRSRAEQLMKNATEITTEGIRKADMRKQKKRLEEEMRVLEEAGVAMKKRREGTQKVALREAARLRKLEEEARIKEERKSKELEEAAKTFDRVTRKFMKEMNVPKMVAVEEAKSKSSEDIEDYMAPYDDEDESPEEEITEDENSESSEDVEDYYGPYDSAAWEPKSTKGKAVEEEANSESSEDLDYIPDDEDSEDSEDSDDSESPEEEISGDELLYVQQPGHKVDPNYAAKRPDSADDVIMKDATDKEEDANSGVEIHPDPDAPRPLPVPGMRARVFKMGGGWAQRLPPRRNWPTKYL
ncbi:hypothetical protein F4677DRAFT_451672 [Hypoxylon crocopeplum]|nr:hypothetical protein F4677DRAFT_451672 [Hypoxylon crocopeplum]